MAFYLCCQLKELMTFILFVVSTMKLILQDLEPVWKMTLFCLRGGLRKIPFLMFTWLERYFAIHVFFSCSVPFFFGVLMGAGELKLCPFCVVCLIFYKGGAKLGELIMFVIDSWRTKLAVASYEHSPRILLVGQIVDWRRRIHAADPKNLG